MNAYAFQRMNSQPAGKFLAISAIVQMSLVSSLLFASCSTPPPDLRARFRDSGQASVVLQYNSRDYIFMTSPSYREQGFLRQIRRPEVPSVMDQMRVARQLAVVSLTWQLEGEELRTVLSDWKDLLKQCGFQRVVFVRGWGPTSVDGAIILEAADLS